MAEAYGEKHTRGAMSCVGLLLQCDHLVFFSFSMRMAGHESRVHHSQLS